MRVLVRLGLVIACVALGTSAAFAQGTIAGVVRDASGAVLPGVTVEAASPALIEKVRNAVTDGTGRYRIEDLRPGDYTVTFTLSGFATVKREMLVVSGSAVITVDADMRVGGVQETITVAGETPVVDTQSTRREITLDNETLRSLPSVRSYSYLLTTVPGLQTNVNNVNTKGKKRIPSLPAVFFMVFATNSYVSSAVDCTRPGTRLRLAVPPSRNAVMTTTAATI